MREFMLGTMAVFMGLIVVAGLVEMILQEGILMDEIFNKMVNETIEEYNAMSIDCIIAEIHNRGYDDPVYINDLNESIRSMAEEDVTVLFKDYANQL